MGGALSILIFPNCGLRGASTTSRRLKINTKPFVMHITMNHRSDMHLMTMKGMVICHLKPHSVLWKEDLTYYEILVEGLPQFLRIPCLLSQISRFLVVKRMHIDYPLRICLWKPSYNVNSMKCCLVLVDREDKILT